MNRFYSIICNERFQESNKEDIVVGYVGTVRARLADFGIIPPEKVMSLS
jgi:hypothetical protein